MNRELTADEIARFHAFGFLRLRGLLSDADLARMHAELDQAMAEQHPGETFDGTQRWNAVLMGHDAPFFDALLEDARFLGPARQLYGESTLGICVDGNRYVGDTGWHPDTVDASQYGVKFAIYLPRVRADSGALRVIPGSHRLPLGDEAFAATMRGLPIAEVPATAIESDPGDVVAFDLRLWHASLGGASDRRMCTVVYYADVDTAAGRDALRRQGAQNVQNIRGILHRPYLYPREWIDAASPTRRRWIERLTEVGYLTAPGLVEGTAALAR